MIVRDQHALARFADILQAIAGSAPEVVHLGTARAKIQAHAQSACKTVSVAMAAAVDECADADATVSVADFISTMRLLRQAKEVELEFRSDALVFECADDNDDRTCIRVPRIDHPPCAMRAFPPAETRLHDPAKLVQALNTFSFHGKTLSLKSRDGAVVVSSALRESESGVAIAVKLPSENEANLDVAFNTSAIGVMKRFVPKLGRLEVGVGTATGLTLSCETANAKMLAHILPLEVHD